jgi:hypothetical protein
MVQAPFAQGADRQVGDYRLCGRLGSGGQGAVCEVFEKDGTRVAITPPRHDRMERAKARARFAKEVAATRRVAAFCMAGQAQQAT